MSSEKIMIAIGGVLIFLFALMFGIMAVGMSLVVNDIAIRFLAVVWVTQIILGILVIQAALWHQKKRNWATIGLIASIFSLVTFGGLIIGPVLGIIGCYMALKKGK